MLRRHAALVLLAIVVAGACDSVIVDDWGRFTVTGTIYTAAGAPAGGVEARLAQWMGKSCGDGPADQSSSVVAAADGLIEAQFVVFNAIMPRCIRLTARPSIAVPWDQAPNADTTLTDVRNEERIRLTLRFSEQTPLPK